MKKYKCFVCKKEMVHPSYNESSFRCSSDNHTMIIMPKDNIIIFIKIRIPGSEGRSIFLKIDYEKMESKVYDLYNNKVVFNYILNVPFNDIDKLTNKLKMIMLFS